MSDIDANSPHFIDNYKYANPYFSRYGEKWEEYIEQAPRLKSHLKVTKMVEWYMEETTKKHTNMTGSYTMTLYPS